jgi:hypothetical protein
MLQHVAAEFINGKIHLAWKSAGPESVNVGLRNFQFAAQSAKKI